MSLLDRLTDANLSALELDLAAADLFVATRKLSAARVTDAGVWADAVDAAVAGAAAVGS